MVTTFNKDFSLNQSVKLVRLNRLCEEIVFSDGIGSSGKGMLSHILSSLERVEKQSNHTAFDYIAYLHWLGKITDDAASTYLKTEADQQLYHIMMGRDVNFRPKDSTGVMQNAFKLKYFLRLFMSEGDSVINRIAKERPILNEAPHDALRSSKLFFDTFESSLKIIYIIRNPYELILDWERRGFGQRIGVDPREFQFSVKSNDLSIPMFMINYHEFNYEELLPIERLTLMIHFCVKSNMEGYIECPKIYKNQILFTHFDDLCSDPWLIIQKISDFLRVDRTSKTQAILKKENLPRNRFEIMNCKQNVTNKLDQRFEKYIVEIDQIYANFLVMKIA
jgi:hypothetical protein